MALSKASGIVFARTLLHAKGGAAEQTLLSQLTSQEVTWYQNALPVTQLPVEVLEKIICLAAPLLYPQPDRNASLRAFGRAGAINNLNGVYKILLRLTTPDFAIKQAARLWSTYFNQGQARAYKDGNKRIVFEVSGFPELPALLRQMLAGYIQGAAEMTGIRNAQVALHEDNPQQWRWITVWD